LQLAGEIPDGVTTAYEGMPFGRYVAALAERGIVIADETKPGAR
jgi:hypothetical protein